MEGGDGVVVLVAGAVVDEGFGEGGFNGGFGCVGTLGEILSRVWSASVGNGGGFFTYHGELQEVQSCAGITVRERRKICNKLQVDK